MGRKAAGSAVTPTLAARTRGDPGLGRPRGRPEPLSPGTRLNLRNPSTGIRSPLAGLAEVDRANRLADKEKRKRAAKYGLSTKWWWG